jgi:homoserine kinase
VQHAAMLVSAVVSQDENALKEALHDRMHEQYRLSYVPHLTDLQKILAREPVLGCVLSGAGPSVLVIVDEKNKEHVHSLLKQWEEAQSQRHTILELDADTQGIRELVAKT